VLKRGKRRQLRRGCQAFLTGSLALAHQLGVISCAAANNDHYDAYAFLSIQRRQALWAL